MYHGRLVTPIRRSKASKPQLKIRFHTSAAVEDAKLARNEALGELPRSAKIIVVKITAKISKIIA